MAGDVATVGPPAGTTGGCGEVAAGVRPDNKGTVVLSHVGCLRLSVSPLSTASPTMSLGIGSGGVGVFCLLRSLRSLVEGTKLARSPGRRGSLREPLDDKGLDCRGSMAAKISTDRSTQPSVVVPIDSFPFRGLVAFSSCRR